MPLPSPQHLTDYSAVDILVERQASGGFGLVVMGPNQLSNGSYPHGQWFALKTIRPKILALPDIRDLFIREALTWVGIWPHANLLTAHTVTEIGTQPYLVLDYAEGGNLRDLLRVDLPFEIHLIWAQMIAAGLDALHTPDPDHLRVGPIIHRDLKPENILIDERGFVRITDFGLAKIQFAVADEAMLPTDPDPTKIQAYRTLRGVAVGTPAYMAPEQWEDAAQVTPAADLYAFGIILSELLAGRYALHDLSIPLFGDWQKLHQRGQGRSLREVEPQVPASVEDLYQACLAVEPEKRPTAREALEILQEAARQLGQESYEAREETPHISEHERNRWHSWSVAYNKFGHYAEALERIDRASSFDPDHPFVLELRGTILVNLKRYEEALAIYDAALAAYQKRMPGDPRQVVAWNMRGSCLRQMGRHAEAETSFEHAIGINPKLGTTWNSRGRNQGIWGDAETKAGHWDSARQHYDLSIAYITRACAIDPTNPRYQQNLALAQRKRTALDSD